MQLLNINFWILLDQECRYENQIFFARLLVLTEILFLYYVFLLYYSVLYFLSVLLNLNSSLPSYPKINWTDLIDFNIIKHKVLIGLFESPGTYLTANLKDLLTCGYYLLKTDFHKSFKMYLDLLNLCNFRREVYVYSLVKDVFWFE